MHTGSYVDPSGSPTGTTPRCDRSARDCCRCSRRSADDAAPWLLLEPTAGQGRSLCAGVDDLEPYLAALDHHPKAGHLPRHLPRLRRRRTPRRARRGAATLDRIVEIGGAGRLRLVHANDSMDVRGAFKDRHQTHRRRAHRRRRVPRAVRPPGDRGRPVRPGDARARATPGNPDIEVLKRLRAEAAARERAAYLPAGHPGAARDDGDLGVDVLPDQGPAPSGCRRSTSWRCASRSRRVALLLIVPAGAAHASRPTRTPSRGGLGALYGVAQILQTVGLAHTAASVVSGFITGMYVVLHPAARGGDPAAPGSGR